MLSGMEVNDGCAEQGEGARIVAMQVPEQMEERLYRHLLSEAAPEKQRKIERFIRRADAYRSLLADAIVRQGLAQQLSLERSALTFSSNAYGKPYVDQGTGLHFNATHSGQWVAVVFSRAPSGIDIEAIKQEDSLPLAKRFFSAAEYGAIVSSDQPMRTFYTYWSMKESYIKALGLGMSKELPSFTVRIGADGSAEVEDNGQRSRYRIYPFELDRSYSSAVCLQDNCRIADLQVWEIEKLDRV